ncbi:hypothetical protein C8R41DRAFT_900870 [Lentinula lateritia]|uniref:Rad60/SUMO-like domain-containing protein n=1 Tax=Lentinula lateritia TaxID=40482 RepID=A0ABQ8VTH4_9AGAR|nr:hypothetical protein C8R41DRAFT_900870 [Lentinula lateritia]
MDKTNLQSTQKKPQGHSVKKSETTGNTTMIKVVGSSGKTVSFEMSKDTLMRSALDAYAEKVGKERHTIRFRWAGVWISSSDTPGTLNMKDNVHKKSSRTELFNSTTPSMDPSWSRDASPSLSDLEREEEKEKQMAEEQKKVFEARMNNLKKKKERAEEKEKLRKEAEEKAVKARKLAEEKARKRAEEKAQKLAEEKARKRAEEKVRKQEEEKARKEAEEKARKKAEDKARKLAEDKARKQAENKARKEKAQELAAEQAQREEEDKAQKCAAEQAQREAKLEESKRRIAEDWKREKLEKRLRREDGKAKQQDVKSKGDELQVAQDKQRGRQASSIWGTLYIRATEYDQSPTPEIVGVKRKRSEFSSTVKDTESDNYDELVDEDNNPGAHSPVARVCERCARRNRADQCHPQNKPKASICEPCHQAKVYCSWSTRTRRIMMNKDRSEESGVKGSFVINTEQRLTLIENKMGRVVDQQQEILDLLSNSYKKLKKVRSHGKNESSGREETDD